ncbi:RNA polymerase-associated protein RapA [Thorsellia kenyensis]|uniref:RNA polymerase-associated protein RapA n=1 Tax=Thorsellia kenyensis TaxID=1549888 RepID=A0ABV6CCB2_9GAMM
MVNRKEESFVIGQRWVNEAEIDLGLGTLIATDTRTVTLFFNQINEQRIYAKAHSPLVRVIYSIGDTVYHQEGWQLTIERIETQEGIITYLGNCPVTNEFKSFIETFLDSNKAFNKPQDRLYAGQFSKSKHFTLRYEARNHIFNRLKSPWQGLSSIRATLIPHQIHIANQVSQRQSPRVLLADEVGLGKTIEAGLIIHQMILTGQTERVLIVVPETLQYQWLVEMLRRFNLRFSLFNKDRYEGGLLDDANPFETEQLIICSLDFLTKDNIDTTKLINAKWDMLVVDEAHHLAWKPDGASSEYQIIEDLAKIIPSVLLLTATPEQLGLTGHFARLRLLDNHRFHDYNAFIEEQKNYEQVADAVASLLANKKLTENEKNAIQTLISDEDTTDLLSQCDEGKENAKSTIINMLLDRHGTSRLLFRNTRQAIKGFPKRELIAIPLPLPKEYSTAIKVHGAFNKNQSKEKKVLDLLYPENIYHAVGGDDVIWWHFDPRVDWLLNTLDTTDDKMLIICAHRTTAIQLEQALREREGIRSAVFHEGLSIIERDRAAAYFADIEDGAQVLICSEIGSEGRNFQFAHKIIMFDLPFNPDLLEQRIGRLDRIGQQHDIKIYVPYLENTAQSILMQWYHLALNAFEQTCPTGRAIYDQYNDMLHDVLLSQDTESETFHKLIEQCKITHAEMKAILEKGRDKLLELNSNGGKAAVSLVEELIHDAQAAQLESFGLELFELIGLQYDERDDDLWVISPSEHMLIPDFPGLEDDGSLVTFQREKALVREDAQFLTWEHPFIRNGLDTVLAGDSGSTAMAALVNPKMPIGSFFVECIFVVETQSPRYLQLTRFMPPTPIRLLIDMHGQSIQDSVPFAALNKKLKPINRKTAQKFIKVIQNQIKPLVSKAEDLSNEKLPLIIESATNEAKLALNLEINRLEALSKINKTVREDEIETLKSHKSLILSHLNEANIRLDAIRVIVVTHE